MVPFLPGSTGSLEYLGTVQPQEPVRFTYYYRLFAYIGKVEITLGLRPSGTSLKS